MPDMLQTQARSELRESRCDARQSAPLPGATRVSVVQRRALKQTAEAESRWGSFGFVGLGTWYQPPTGEAHATWEICHVNIQDLVARFGFASLACEAADGDAGCGNRIRRQLGLFIDAIKAEPVPLPSCAASKLHT